MQFLIILAVFLILFGISFLLKIINNHLQKKLDERNRILESIKAAEASKPIENPLAYCIEELEKLVIEEYTAKDGSVKKEDILLLAGNITGMFIFLSFDFKIKSEPGTVFLSEEANQAGPVVINNILKLLKSFEFDPEKINPDVYTYNGNLNYIERTGEAAQKAVNVIKKCNLDYKKAIEICECVDAHLLSSYSNDIAINKAFGIVIFGIIEGSKTFPNVSQEITANPEA